MAIVKFKYPMKPVRADAGIFDRIDTTQYILEKKYDGFRAMVQVDESNSVSVWTRDKRPIAIPKNLQAQLQALELPKGTILDGEIWNPLKRGGWIHMEKGECKLTMWDAIWHGSSDLSNKPLSERRSILENIAAWDKVPDVKLTEVLPASVATYETILKEAEDFQEINAIRSGFIHGVVLKRTQSPRRDHATTCKEHPDWLKLVFSGMSRWHIK